MWMLAFVIATTSPTLADAEIRMAAGGPVTGVLETASAPCCPEWICYVASWWKIGTSLFQSDADLEPYLGQEVTAWINWLVCSDGRSSSWVNGVTPTSVEPSSWGRIKSLYR